MKKRVLTLLTMITILSTLSAPALAGPPTEVGGVLTYTPSILDVRVADGNTFLHTSEEALWTGNFEGDSTEDGRVVIHSSGFWSYKAISSFEGTVDGQSGTLEILMAGKRPDALSDWQGRWVILSGTDELANLRGRGTWWGPGAPDVGEWGEVDYSGKIHFEPE
jgi:hypothetical protein